MELALVDCGLAAVDCRRLRHDLSGFGFDFFSFLITHPFSPLAQVYEIITAVGITKRSEVQEKYLELEVKSKLIPCCHKCTMEAREPCVLVALDDVENERMVESENHLPQQPPQAHP
ncbi:hypothetical protein Tco_0889403 [Tanacetum coccineum]